MRLFSYFTKHFETKHLKILINLTLSVKKLSQWSPLNSEQLLALCKSGFILRIAENVNIYSSAIALIT